MNSIAAQAIVVKGPSNKHQELQRLSLYDTNGQTIDVVASALRDTLSNLASGNSIPSLGRLVIATDASPNIFAIGDGVTAWLALPKYEERVEPVRASTTGVTGVGPSATVDRTGLVITFTVGTVPWLVEAREPYFYSESSSALPMLHIRDAAGVSKAQAMGNISSTAISAFYYGAMTTAVERITVPGTYTRKASVQNFGTVGTINFGANLAVYVASIVARIER